MVPALPKRPANRKIVKTINISKFSELLNKTDEKILNNMSTGVLIDNTDLLKNNFDFLLKIVNSKKDNMFYSKDYECLKFIEENLSDKCNIQLGLVDDLDNKERSYIDVDSFEKTSIVLPLTYSMWGIQSKSDFEIASYFYKNNLYPMRVNGFSNITLDFLKQVKEIVLKLNEQLVNYTELEKIIIVSNYIQNHVQYVDHDNVSEGQKGIYITDSKALSVKIEDVHSAENVLLHNYGVCEGIANATTLLLNNPILNINTRSAWGSNHVWNVIKIDGNYYYVDNTWNITRNNDQYPESLKAKSFSSQYLLFGSETANEIGHHVSDVLIPNVELNDYERETIDSTKKELTKKINFSSYSKPIFESRIRK